MGFSLTGTHVIFFVASVIIAGAVSGVLISVITDVMKSYEEQGQRVQDKLDIEFKIINDPDNIPTSGNYYLFYLKNIGSKKITTTNQTFTLFIDGEIIPIANFYFADSSIQNDVVTTLYIDNSEISSGDHVLKVVGPQDIDDKFTFTI